MLSSLHPPSQSDFTVLASLASVAVLPSRAADTCCLLQDKHKIWLYRDKATGEPKGDCTVTYEDPFTAASAVSWFNNQDFNGAPRPDRLPDLKPSLETRPMRRCGAPNARAPSALAPSKPRAPQDSQLRALGR